MNFSWKSQGNASKLKWFQTIVLYNLKRKFLYKSRHKIACWLFLLDLQLVSSFVWTKSYFDIHYYSHSYKKENRLLVFFCSSLPKFFLPLSNVYVWLTDSRVTDKKSFLCVLVLPSSACVLEYCTHAIISRGCIFFTPFFNNGFSKTLISTLCTLMYHCVRGFFHTT